jgi:glycerol-3-phosphate dehydrogenase (NAD+)
VKTKKSWEQLEEELLKGQKLQGTGTCIEVMELLKSQNLVEHFPLFHKIYQISFESADPNILFQWPSKL